MNENIDRHTAIVSVKCASAKVSMCLGTFSPDASTFILLYLLKLIPRCKLSNISSSSSGGGGGMYFSVVTLSLAKRNSMTSFFSHFRTRFLGYQSMPNNTPPALNQSKVATTVSNHHII